MSKNGMPKRRGRVSLVVAAGLCGALAFGGATAAYANDIQGHWNEAGMQEWIDYGILKGYDNGDYGPDNPTTRAELVAFLDRVMDYQKTTDNSFSDLDKNWYTEVVLRGVAAGVIAGDDAGTMRPNDPVTREEAATVFARVLALDVDNAKPAEFSDASQVHSWAKGSVNAMVEAGYINGYPDGTFAPTKAITRAEVIGMLNNMFADLYQKAGTYSDGSDSSAVISADDVILKDEVVEGDLVIAEGVADGHVVLDGVTVKGKLIVRGGGANSVVIKGKSSVGTVLVDRQDDKVRISAEGDAKVGDVVIADDTASVKVEGEVGSISVEAPKAKVEVAASVEKIVVPADDAQLVLTPKADVKSIAVSGDAAVVEAEKGAAVEKVVISGADVTVSGSGDVEAVEVAEGASGATVETEGTKVENNGSGEVTIPGGAIAEGGSTTTPEATTPGGGGGGTVVPVHKKSELKTDIGEKQFVVGQQVEFTFTTVANDDKGIMVLGTSNFSDQSAIKKLEYYEPKDGEWHELKGDFGPAQGFPMADATSKFRVTFSKAGGYSFRASMKRADNGEVLCDLDVAFSVAPAGVEVKTEAELKAKLADQSVSEIKLGENITVNEQLVVSRQVAIHGQGHTIARAGNDAGVVAGSAAGILVEGDGAVSIDNLTVSGPNTSNLGWDSGEYGIKVYNAKNVILQDVRVIGANAGIQVNSSTVKLAGTVDVSGNEFGGIEVCKSANEGLENPSLDVTGATLKNADEDAFSNPTIWVDGYNCGENLHPGSLDISVVQGFDMVKGTVKSIHDAGSNKHQLWFLLKCDEVGSPELSDNDNGGEVLSMEDFGYSSDGPYINVGFRLNKAASAEYYQNIEWIRVSLVGSNGKVMATRTADKARVSSFLVSDQQYGAIDGQQSAAFKTRVTEEGNAWWVSSPCTIDANSLPAKAVVQVKIDGTVYQASNENLTGAPVQSQA